MIRTAVRRLLRPPAVEAVHVRAPEALLEVARDGIVPLAERGPNAGSGPLRIGVVVPSFRHGSGGHSTLANLLRALEARGHTTAVFVEDDEGRHVDESPADVERTFKAFFGPLQGRVHKGTAAWQPVDVALATGWQTVHRVLRLPGAGARAYLVQDHEPEFYGTSAEAVWAAETYRLGLHCICASPWLATHVEDRYDASTSAFDLGVRHDIYEPREVGRTPGRVVFYARAVTPRRAVPLGLLALEELHRRRPTVEIGLFGEARPVATRFPTTQFGVLTGEALAGLYSGATLGVVCSMTNPSLVPTEMLACGLPVVDIASEAMRATFGDDGPIALAPFDPIGLADTIERLLDDPADRMRRKADGIAYARGRTWERAAEQVEAGLRAALA